MAIMGRYYRMVRLVEEIWWAMTHRQCKALQLTELVQAITNPHPVSRTLESRHDMHLYIDILIALLPRTFAKVKYVNHPVLFSLVDKVNPFSTAKTIRDLHLAMIKDVNVWWAPVTAG